VYAKYAPRGISRKNPLPCPRSLNHYHYFFGRSQFDILSNEGSHVEFSLYEELLQNRVPREVHWTFGRKFDSSDGAAQKACAECRIAFRARSSVFP
jgi:hypothetical protein